MNDFDFDLFVIGGGSGGVRAARVAAQLGARVAIAEKHDFGGTCVNVGCIPKKLLVYASRFADELADSSGFGWEVGSAAFDWASLAANVSKEVGRLRGVYGRLLDQAGVERVGGHAHLVDAHTVEVDGRRYRAAWLLVATGGWPKRPDIAGIELAVTSNEMFSLPVLPRSALVLGGGFIGLEFASILHRLGCTVELVHRHPLPLHGFDHDARRFVCDEFEREGIRMHLDTVVDRIERAPEPSQGLVATMHSGVEVKADLVLCAVGRRPRTDGLGLERIGVHLGDRGQVLVDEEYRTSVSSIFAIGDVIDHLALTPVALAQGTRVAHALFGTPLPRLDYDFVPAAVFSQPPVGAVGLTEEAARARGHHLRVFKSAFTPLKLSLSPRTQRTWMKLVVDAETDRVLGVHMVGDDAPEIIQGFAVALTAGATKAQFDATIGIHPTAAEELVTMRTAQ